MFGSFVHSRFMPCPECGSSVERAESPRHLCDPERRLDFRLFGLRDEVEAFESELTAYLETPRGRFELWYAARARQREH